jgi:glycosyltransferase involved in cell wall biosynthesis
MKISIAMPVFNNEAYVADAIESVLSQTHTDFEFFIIDDGSTDGSSAIIDDYAAQDSRIRVLRHENWGLPRSINQAVELATTEWIARFDGDDIMLPKRLETQIAFINAHPEAKVISCAGYFITPSGERHGQVPVRGLTSEAAFRAYYKTNQPMILLHPGVMFHRQTILDVGGYRDIWPCEDVDLWNRVTEQGHVILEQNDALILYRVHDGSVTIARWKETIVQLEWVQACSKARREGKSPPSFQEYVGQRNRDPIVTKIMRWRRIQAQYLDKMAGYEKMKGNHGKSAFNYGLVSLLQPFYSLRKFSKQLSPAT